MPKSQKPALSVTTYRNEGNPLDPNDGRATMVKPGELIDFREMEPLTLYDRRCFNLLVANALFVSAARGDGQVGEDTIRDLAEDRRMSVEAAGVEHDGW